jgi:putative mRNA 3-end processing factor
MARPLGAEVELTSAGMRVAESPLFLDAKRPRALSFVSHAHSDHIAPHQRVIATAATASLMAAKLKKRTRALTAPYGQTFDLGALKLSLHPAGHVRGSAQLLVQRDGRRILYTGDLGLGPSLTAEPAEVVPCDVLILEATFGHPRYRLPSRPEALARVDEFIDASFRRGEVPVLMAYALGKGQEVIAHLANRLPRSRVRSSAPRSLPGNGRARRDPSGAAPSHPGLQSAHAAAASNGRADGLGRGGRDGSPLRGR